MFSIVPQYLLDFATNIKEKNNSAILNLKCQCNNEYFILFKNEETKEDKARRKKWEILLKKYNDGGYSDSSGNIYLIKKKLFGIKSEEIKINKSEISNTVSIIKAKCSKCGKEYVIFDNTKNGYDAVVDNIEIKNLNKNNVSYSYKAINTKDTIIKVKIINDLTYEEFVKEFPKYTIDNFKNAFSEISIYSLKDKRYKCVFNEETR